MVSLYTAVTGRMLPRAAGTDDDAHDVMTSSVTRR